MPADGTDLSACSDGECEVEVTGPTEFATNPELDLATLAVDSITSEEVVFTVASPTGFASQPIVPPGSGFTFNDLTVNVLDVVDGSALVRMETA